MLQQILLHTPFWVWAILAFLLYRGLLATTTREQPVRRVFLLPLVMLGLSLQGIVSGFAASPLALTAWLAATAAAAAVAWRRFDPATAVAGPARGSVTVRGSWTPLVLMMAIFCIKYAVGITLAMRPELAGQPPFAVAVCAMYGMFSGLFAGKALRIAVLYRRADQRRWATG